MLVIRITADGVLCNTGTTIYDSTYGTLMRRQGITFNDADTYDLRNFDTATKKALEEAFLDSTVMQSVSYTANAFLVQLNSLLQDYNDSVKLVLHIQAPNSDVFADRSARLLEYVKRYINCEDILVTDDSDESDVAITVNPMELHYTGYMLLLDKGYNKEDSNIDLQGANYARVSNILDIIPKLAEFLKKNCT